MTERPMSAAAFRAWRESHGMSERAASDALGLSRGALRTYERSGAPLFMALACAAYSQKIEPLLTATAVKATKES